MEKALTRGPGRSVAGRGARAGESRGADKRGPHGSGANAALACWAPGAERAQGEAGWAASGVCWAAGEGAGPAQGKGRGETAWAGLGSWAGLVFYLSGFLGFFSISLFLILKQSNTFEFK